MKVKNGDEIIVTTGVYKGKKGKVIKIFQKKNSIVVEKINLRKRHIRSTPERSGQVVQYEAPLDVSKVKLICPKCTKATRVGYETPKKGKKFRICKKCGASVEKPFKKSA